MYQKSAHLQALYARRRETEHNRIERTEATNKYFDHWGKVTARFENWTTPEYYKQAEQQLENSKQQKEKQTKLFERQQKLAQLLKMEKQSYEQELQDKERNPRRNLDTKTLEKIDENLKEQQQMRRKLELEGKLYGKWRHGVDDDNLVFDSKSDNQVLAKLNWLDRKVDEQIHHEKKEVEAEERQIKLHQELNKTEELQKQRQQIREQEIREIRTLQEYHMEQLRDRQKETDELKEKEKQLKDNLNELEKELELLEENYAVVSVTEDFRATYNFNNIKIFTRKRSEVFRNQINLCLSILERTLGLAKNSHELNNFKSQLEKQLEIEQQKLTQIEGMYESEAKYSLRSSEETWHQENRERYNKLKQILKDEHQLIKADLNEIMRKHEELLELRDTHLTAIENSSEKLKFLIQEEENSPRHEAHILPYEAKPVHQIHTQLEESADTPFYSPRRYAADKIRPLELDVVQPEDNSIRRNCFESSCNNMSPRCYDTHDCNDINQASNSFNNLNVEGWQGHQGHMSHRDLESQKQNAQRTMQVVTPETEADRPRFGRKHVAWN